jgi:translation initiation factor 1
MSGLFAGTPLERPVTCERCAKPLAECGCPRDAAGRVCMPSQQRLSVRLEKRRGKPVTIASGFDAEASDRAGILKALRTALGTGGTIGEDANGKPMVEVQGDHRQRVSDLLRGMGYPIK